ncbi:signal peptidase I [Deinococcus maricopensis]|uniref:Signal peptidase I n=1 Tax=Deinococcus maricopensis (strain DSM 21211 / LMG 22137 / NRRL B-23946 / LB-34) TaxID=709986 RepID=E8UB16_DEIML|nr:signal peptidase I [Deinococcus maricopensis]ADV68255.1 signal peptidase I [Deinococcus maricopensis DSM 21211]
MNRRLHAFWNSWLGSVLIVVLFTQAAATGLRVDGVSMLPNLRHGEFVIIPKYEGWAHRLGLGTYARGDVIVFKPPRDADAEWTRTWRGLPLPWAYRPYLIKRVVALPGDHVRIHAGVVTVNGQPVPRDADTTAYWRAQGCWDTASTTANLAHDPRVLGEGHGTETLTVPPGTVYVLGDNRSPGGSVDSRAFGPVPLSDVAGRAALSVWPLLRHRDARSECSATRAVHLSGPLTLNVRAHP